jgi:5-methylcytosine-specific restriction endonuclease McrA
MGRTYRKKSSTGYGFKIHYPPEFNEEFKKAVRTRDGYTCAICNQRNRLDVHHIDYNRYNTIRLNCISLCRDCHKMIHLSGWTRKHEWKMKLWQLASERERKNASSR